MVVGAFLQNMDFCFFFFSYTGFVIVLFQKEVAKCWSLWCQRFICGKLSEKIKPFDINYPSFTREHDKSLWTEKKMGFLKFLWKHVNKWENSKQNSLDITESLLIAGKAYQKLMQSSFTTTLGRNGVFKSLVWVKSPVQRFMTFLTNLDWVLILYWWS